MVVSLWVSARRVAPRGQPQLRQPRRKLHHRHDQVHGTHTHTRTLGRSQSQSLSQEVKVQNQVNLIVEYIASERARARAVACRRFAKVALLSRGRLVCLLCAREPQRREGRARCERVIAPLTSFLKRAPMFNIDPLLEIARRDFNL